MTNGTNNNNLANFLLKLAEDEQLIKRFRDTPHTVMDEAGLSQDEKDVILSGNIGKIRATISGIATVPAIIQL